MKANGNGSGATRCPHNCSRCRAIELGLGNKPLNNEEFVAVQGGYVESSREGRIEWSQAAVEAELAMDVARIAYGEAGRVFEDIARRAQAERLKAARLGETVQSQRLREIDLAVEVAREELDDAQKRLQDATSRYHELARAESDQHQQEQLRMMYEAAELERSAYRTSVKSARKGALRRILG